MKGRKEISEETKLVSIGIPTFNRPEDLEKCVKSLLNQTYSNIEIIISDNNSTNSKSKLLYKSNLFKNPKIKLIQNNKNIGILKNTKKVLDYAKGEYFCWVSDDDWRSNIFIEEMVEDIEKLGSGYICFCKYLETVNDCSISKNHLKTKNSFNLLKSKISLIRKFYFYLLDNANGKCNLFYSLIPTYELKKVNFKKASNNWKDLSMDRNIVQSLLTNNKVFINHNLLVSLKVNNKKYYKKKESSYKKRFSYKILEILKNHNAETNFLKSGLKNKISKFTLRILYFIKLIILIYCRLSFKFKIFLKNNISKNYSDKRAIKRIESYQSNSKKILNLSDITLVCVATTEVEKASMALRYSMLNINYGKVLLLSNYIPWNMGKDICFRQIKKFKNVDEWGKFIIYDLYKFITTNYILLVHPDGFVVNPELWDEKFKDYDYIGAPWPPPNDDFSYRTTKGEIIEVGNSVSIRSRKLLALPREINLKWNKYYGNYNEDGFLCVHNKYLLESHGIKFAKKDLAYQFGIETFLKEFKSKRAFTFHKWAKENNKYPKFKEY